MPVSDPCNGYHDTGLPPTKDTQPRNGPLFLDVLNEAARDLPEDYDIEIDIQQGYAGVNLYTPWGERSQCPLTDEPLFEQVRWLVNRAKELHAREQSPS